jgi:hypothetical protein
MRPGSLLAALVEAEVGRRLRTGLKRHTPRGGEAAIPA